MQLRKLIINNIGAYYTDHTFDFSISVTKNIILIGGKNGSGKTTILDAIRIALYGPLAFGYKNENDNYQKKLFSMLNKKAIKEHESLFQIFLEFDYVEDFQKSVYTIMRQWNPLEKKARETLSILKDGNYLKELETDEFQSKIRTGFPPQLLELCLFDGETISKVINNDLISSYLKETANVMFNLDLFVNLNKDLELYRKQVFNQIEPELHSMVEKSTVELDKLWIQKSDLIERIIWINQQKAIKNQEIEKLKNEFSIYGGLKQEEREQVLANTNKLEQKRKAVIDEIKAFTLNMFPMLLVYKEIIEVQIQLEHEQQFETYDYLTANISVNHVSEILSKQGVSSSAQIDSACLLKDLLNLVKPNISQPIHRASFAQRSEIQTILSKLNKLDTKEIEGWFSESSSLLTRIQKLRKKLELNDTNKEFKDLVEQIELLSKELQVTDTSLIKKEFDLQKIEETITLKKFDLTQLQQNLVTKTKAETTIQNINNTIEVNNKFLQIQLEEKLLHVQEEAILMLNQLLRKENFIRKIVISPNDFEFTLLSESNNEIDKKSLSAGEKQILLLSLIWAVVKVSERKIPFVFDTLLGRLDTSHKQNVLLKFIPNCGDQVIILSTDSEVDIHHLNLIRPHLASVGTLITDHALESSKIEVGNYFDIIYGEGDPIEVPT
ncbi:MAG TPA: DNA sulfur modification protein DndD [Bacilli bacterium]